MADSTSLDITPTPVTICGRTYHLRGEGDPDYLHHLASMVDAKMRDIAESTGTADSLKVAILAALNLADDCVRGRGETETKELECTLVKKDSEWLFNECRVVEVLEK